MSNENWHNRLFQIDFDITRKWSKVGNSNVYAPYYINIRCPNNLCNSSLGNLNIPWSFHNDTFLWATTSCAVCKQNVRLYMIDPPKDLNDSLAMQQSLLYMLPTPPLLDSDLPKKIIEISPMFITIYSQSVMAEKFGLNEIVGMGYRKSLEFLIKDYLIHKDPSKTDEIKGTDDKNGKPLGQCINEIKNPQLKAMAKRANWLGNDETHYYRKWKDKDLDDLKKLIELTLHWLHMEFLTEDYETEMKG